MHTAPCFRLGNLGVFVIVFGVAAFAGGSGFAQQTAPSAGSQQNPPSAPVTVVNTTANPVPITSATPVPVSGTITLSQPVTVEETFAPGRSPKRYGPIDAGPTTEVVGHELIPPLTAGQKFILTHLNAVGFSNISGIALVRGGCTLQLRVGTTYTPFMVLPLVNSGFVLTGSESAFLPLAATEGLYVSCSGTAADGTQPSQGFRVTAGGYFVPAVQ